MMLGEYKEALNDARKSVALEPTFVKVKNNLKLNNWSVLFKIFQAFNI